MKLAPAARTAKNDVQTKHLSRRSVALGAGALALETLSANAKPFLTWPDGARAAVSLAYDDGYRSQLENGVPELAERGFKATFFLTVQNINAGVADWVALSKKGHEIGNHSMTHPCKLRALSGEQFDRDEITAAEAYFDTNFGGPKPRNFAYPCGFVRLGQGGVKVEEQNYLDIVRPTFLSARTVDGPPNDPRNVLGQRYFLNAFEPTYDLDTPRLAQTYVEQALRKRHWAILVFHEVLEARKSEGDTSIAVHREIMAYLASESIWCAPVRDVFYYVTGIG